MLNWLIDCCLRTLTLDGEAVVFGEDGIAVFDRLHRRQKVTDAMLYAFDLLELNGEDLRSLPLLDRKAKLAKLLVRSRSGIVFNDHSDEDGAAIFQHACKMGLDGIVSKWLSAPYRRPVAGLDQSEEPGQPGHEGVGLAAAGGC